MRVDTATEPLGSLARQTVAIGIAIAEIRAAQLPASPQR
jgi:hypothetical protein